MARILVVDDMMTIRRILRTLLTNMGHVVDEAVNGQALQTSIAYLTTPLLNVALGVGMFAVQSPTFPWMAIVLAASFSVYGLLKRYVPLDAIAQAENDKDMRQWEPLNSMLLISSTLAFARYDDKRMWAYDVIENAMTRNLVNI